MFHMEQRGISDDMPRFCYIIFDIVDMLYWNDKLQKTIEFFRVMWYYIIGAGKNPKNDTKRGN